MPAKENKNVDILINKRIEQKNIAFEKTQRKIELMKHNEVMRCLLISNYKGKSNIILSKIFLSEAINKNNLKELFVNSRSPLEDLTNLRQEASEAFLENESKSWFLNDIKACLFIINFFSKNNQSDMLSVCATQADIFVNAEKLVDFTAWQQTSTGWQKISSYKTAEEMMYHKTLFMAYLVECWKVFNKEYFVEKWIKKDNKKLLDWIYTYKPKESWRKFLVDFYHPSDNDYEGKYLHITFSLNLQDNTLYEKRGIGKTKITSQRREMVKYLSDAWLQHERTQRKDSNKLVIALNKSTKSQLEELMASEQKNAKEIIKEALDMLYQKKLTIIKEQVFKYLYTEV